MLPFPLHDYRQSGTLSDLTVFDELLARSVAVIEADGCWMSPEPLDPAVDALARHRRGRGYRAQAELMLQRCDALVAVFDPLKPGRAGGTAETVRRAIELGMPVLVLETRAPRSAAAWVLLESLVDLQAWRAPPQPERLQVMDDGGFASLVQRLTGAGTLPAPKPASRVLRWLWPALMRSEPGREPQSKPRAAGNEQAVPADNLAALRRWASTRNKALSNSYRSGFVATYGLGAMAASLAAISLAFMAGAALLSGGTMAAELKVFLLGLALLKLSCVWAILRIVKSSEHGAWNRDALATRYLAEHLRALAALSPMGLLRPPMPRGHHHAEIGRDFSGVAERLAATVRAAPLGHGLEAVAGAQPPRWRLVPEQALESLRTKWLSGQQAYHERNHGEMKRLAVAMRTWARWLGQVVLVVVLIDILLIALGLFGLPLAKTDTATLVKLALVAAAAALPAWIAAANGVREQSEAERLAARSRQLAKDLTRVDTQCAELLQKMRAHRAASDDPGAWTLETLHIAEQCALLVAEDVAEWGVLYGKDLAEG